MERQDACASMIGLILASVEGTLDGPGRAELDGHLAACAGCRLALDEQVAVKRALVALEWPAVSSGFAARVRERLEPVPAWLDLVNWRRWTLRLAPLAAALALLALLPSASEQDGSGAGGQAGVTAEGWSAATSSAVSPGLEWLLDPAASPVTLVSPFAGADR